MFFVGDSSVLTSSQWLRIVEYCYTSVSSQIDSPAVEYVSDTTEFINIMS